MTGGHNAATDAPGGAVGRSVACRSFAQDKQCFWAQDTADISWNHKRYKRYKRYDHLRVAGNISNG